MGLSKSKNGSFRYYVFGEVPSRDVLAQQGFAPGTEVFIRVWGATRGEGMGALAAAGCTFSDLIIDEDSPAPNGRVEVEKTFRIDHQILRGIAKIAFEYMVHATPDELGLMPVFDEVRTYILRDQRPPRTLVNLVAGASAPAPAHTLAMSTTQDGRLLVQVRLLCRFTYEVELLGPAGLERQLWVPDSVHFFDTARLIAHKIV